MNKLNNKIVYRPDIDGLRAFAVLPVILFHAGVSWIPGGFVGVDIFFVISGFLITSIIVREISGGKFSYREFYERRIRRIIPALLVVLLTTIVVFQVIALPDQVVGTAKSGLAALFSVSNFYFWRQSGYFSPAAELMPLLHTWSLAVEEQFYFILPVLLLTIKKLGLPLRKIVVVCWLALFGIGYWFSVYKPSAAYYLLPARAWELGVGVLLAVGVVPDLRSVVLRECVAVVGLILVLVSFFLIHDAMPFPGWVAGAPCIGAAMLIYVGPDTLVNRLVLAFRPVVWIGLLSYSLYLWHWPILVMFRVAMADVHLGFGATFVAVVLTFGAAWACWKFVEQPFRNRKSMPIKRVYRTLVVSSLVIVGVSALVLTTKGLPGRLNDAATIALAGAADIDRFGPVCEWNGSLPKDCRFGPSEAPLKYLIVGDSHAAAIRPAIEASGIMGNSAGALVWRNTCPFLLGGEMTRLREREKCISMKKGVFDVLKEHPTIDTVVLSGRWQYQLTGTFPESGGSQRAWLVDSESKKFSRADSVRVLRQSLRRSLKELESAGVKIIVLGAIPEPGLDVPRMIALAHLNRVDVPRQANRDVAEVRAKAVDNVIENVVSEFSRSKFIPLWDAFCSSDGCMIERGGRPIYYDDDHLSVYGAQEFVAPILRSRMLQPSDKATPLPIH